MDKLTTPYDPAYTWAEIACAIKAEVSNDTYARWFKDIEPVSLDDLQLTLRVPNTIYQFWIETNYLPMLQSAALVALGSPREVRFQFAAKSTAAPAAGVPVETVAEIPLAEPETVAPPPAPSTDSGMNPRNTFETFVVGANSQFAHAACVRVSDNPAKNYNPLFLYAASGSARRT